MLIHDQILRSRILRSSLAPLVAISLCLGCQTMTEPERPLTPAEARLREQRKDFGVTIFQGAVSGAALGAAAGGICVLLDACDKDAIWQGAAAGAVAGTAAGVYIANKKETYATEEAALDSAIADIQADNDRLETMVADTETIVAADKKKLDRIDADVKANRITQAEAKEQLEAIDDNRRFLKSTIADLEKRQNEWKAVADETRKEDPAKAAEMDAQIKTLEGRVATMKTELDALNTRRSISVVS